jgi:hypothetical protein
MNVTPNSHASRAASQPTPMVLTNAELLREAEALTLRIARSPLPLRDVSIVQALVARLRSAT